MNAYIANAQTTALMEELTAKDEETMTKKVTSLVTKDFLLPPLDDRQYEYLEFPSNELRVILVSDPSSSEAACCMNVHVGACADSPRVQGLAHFHEHMLFLGTKEYPQENSFESFLTTNGGSSNAYTDSENTVYYFSMEAETGSAGKVEESLLRFGSFFTNPLFTESATGRELNAINSEHSKNLQSDSFRVYQVNKERASSRHPFSRFFTGNQQTLLDDTKSAGVNLRQELIDFNKQYYSSNQMVLAVASPQPLSQLKPMVQKAFGNIPDYKGTKPELSWQQNRKTKVYNNKVLENDSVIPSFGHVVEIIPVQQLRQVTLTWPVQWDTEEEHDIAALYIKQADYISHVIGHEGPGSLLSFLKNERNWANSVVTGFGNELSDLSTIDVTVELTPLGLTNLDNVIASVFGTIDMLRTTPFPDYTFEECLQLTDLEWRFATKGSPSNNVQSLATNLGRYEDNPKLVVAGPRRLAVSNSLEEFNSQPRVKGDYYSTQDELLRRTKKLVQQLLDDYMTVDNVLITTMSQSFAENEKDFLTEQWYGTKYRAKPIPSTTIQRWKNAFAPRGITYPKPNVFIPTEKGLNVRIPVPLSKLNEPKAIELEDRLKPIPPPTKIRDDDRWTVYYKPDDRFGQPKAFVVFQLLSTEPYDSPEKVALGMLYQECAIDRLEEYAYDARLAGLSYDLQILPRGVRVTFGGYNDKLQEFATSIIQTLTSSKVLPRNKAEFDRYIDTIQRGLAAFDVKQPYAHASYYAYQTLQPRSFQYGNAVIRSAMSKIKSASQLESYLNTCWKRAAKAEALLQGNLSQKEALELINTIDTALSFTKLDDPKYYPPRLTALSLPSSATQLTVSDSNPVNDNAAVHVMLQSVSRSTKDQILIEILSAIVSEPFYNQLRTQQQLGYIVSSGIRAIEDTRTIAFIVQSGKEPVSKLTKEILKYLDSLATYLEKDVSRATFGTYVKALIDRKTEPEKLLGAETTRHWNEIASGKFVFNRMAVEVGAALDLTKDDLLQFWNTIYTSDKRRLLITEIVPQRGTASNPNPPPTKMMTPDNSNELGIDDIPEFRKIRESS
eukprot:CAMPEP_0194175336 /NCGR_PEP_ID=MMETSP0154-20130528/9376_1 /TAXON_ID=1049557 /ORGANISM="Thalassiothrix antarctica, Strain L6-D1" /LENGTH=1065 /DNA_ID=CAMNT_0038889095 /DNA_START=460 /DNA_END=3657 /DNA_ORIENTATION=+